MLLQYRGVTYETASPEAPQNHCPEPFLTYRGVGYQPNWGPMEPVDAMACYRGVPYKINGEATAPTEKPENALITVTLLKATHFFSMGHHS